MIAPMAKRPRSLSKTHLSMIEAAGRASQLLGIPRSTGQIYGLLYLSPNPLSLDDIAESLGISRGGASVGARTLLAWRAIRLAWVHGQRRDYYEIDTDLTNVLRFGYADIVQRRLQSSQERFERISASLEEEYANGVMTPEDYKVCSDRLKNIGELQKKLEAVLPLLEKIL